MRRPRVRRVGRAFVPFTPRPHDLKLIGVLDGGGDISDETALHAVITLVMAPHENSAL